MSLWVNRLARVLQEVRVEEQLQQHQIRFVIAVSEALAVQLGDAVDDPDEEWGESLRPPQLNCHHLDCPEELLTAPSEVSCRLLDLTVELDQAGPDLPHHHLLGSVARLDTPGGLHQAEENLLGVSSNL